MIQKITRKIIHLFMWEDILRYPRFFISSMIGLVLILLTPIITQLKKVNDKKIIYFSLFLITTTLFLILKEMVRVE